MSSEHETLAVSLRRSSFGEKEREGVRYGGLTASLFRYDTGIEAIRLSNARGSVVVLPYMGQIVWSATFDGVELAMQSMFREPRPAKIIVETYGCLAYHAGLLRNGVPSPADTHVLHGEMPCAEMDEAGIACGVDQRGPWIAVTGSREYAMGFGAHYRATPRVVVRAEDTGCEIVMEVENLSAAPMDLMYLCHVNFAFAEGARIVQQVPFTPEHVVTRTVIPGHVTPTPDYRALLAALAADPARMRRLTEPERYDPEQVFYIKGLKPGADGLVHFLMARREGDAFAICWDPEAMPHTIRWILANSDQRVAAFAMPATCEPEGYLAEKRKGNVRALAGNAKASFQTRIEYIDKDHAAAAAAAIEGDRPQLAIVHAVPQGAISFYGEVPEADDLSAAPGDGNQPFPGYTTRAGMTVENLTPQLGEVFGAKDGKGVLVRTIDKGSAAETAGIKAGDVIRKIGSHVVANRTDFRRILSSHKKSKVNVVVIREKREQNVTMTISPDQSKKGDIEASVHDLEAELRPALEEARENALQVMDDSDVQQVVQDVVQNKDEIKCEINNALEMMENDLRDLHLELHNYQ